MHVLFEYIELWGAYAGWVFGACGSAGSSEFCGPDAGEAPAGDSGAWGGPGQGGAGRGVAVANGRAGGQDSVNRATDRSSCRLSSPRIVAFPGEESMSKRNYAALVSLPYGDSFIFRLAFEYKE